MVGYLDDLTMGEFEGGGLFKDGHRFQRDLGWSLGRKVGSLIGLRNGLQR